MKHVGIAAHSVEGAALCLRTLAGHGSEDLGHHLHPDVTLDCIAMGWSMPAWEAGDHAVIRRVLEHSVSRLQLAGARFFVCPDNTAHIALQVEGNDLPIPGLHIAHVVAGRAAADGRRRVGVLGTKYTMTDPMYPEALAAQGIDHLVPDEQQRHELNRIIFSELVEGEVRESSREFLYSTIEDLQRRGCDAVALVCTEIPLLVGDAPPALPVLDSTRLLARAAYDVAVGRAAMPTWCGGPYGG